MVKRLLKKTVHSFARDLFAVYCDPVQRMQLDALDDTVAFIKAHAMDALALRTREAVMDLALREALDGPRAEGLYLEFGVHKGATVRRIADRVAPRRVYGFDSFEGLPEDWSGWNVTKGGFSLGGRRPKVPDTVTLVPGFFDASLPGWLGTVEGPVAFIHVDCDLYSSTKTVFDLLGDRIGTGTVLLFDEYFNYINWRQHEHRAFVELVDARGLAYRYLAYSTRQMAVRVD